MRTMFRALASGVAGLALAAAACNDATPTNERAAAADAGPSGAATPPIETGIDAGADGGAVVSLAVAPLTLVPAFSPTTYDYYVRCTAAENAVTVTIGTASDAQTIALEMAEDQAVVVQGQYWIRCLPSDFPTVTVTTSGNGPTPGYYLANSATFAIVFDTNGTPVWYQRGTVATNVDAPAVDTLSFMLNATAPFGTSLLSDFELDALDTGATTAIMAVGGATDAHELQTLPNGDHLLFTYPIESGVDLTGLSTFGNDETMADCEIQEIDPSGNLVWSWLASDHVDPVQESIEGMVDAVIGGVSVVDVFHCNAIDVDSSGNLLLSMRHANALFYIDRSTNQVTWKLGGTAYNKDGAVIVPIQGDPLTTFSMQHDARFLPNGDISLFDDHGASAGVARGVEYTISAGTATVAWQFLGTAQSQYEGSFRRYTDGESVIGWGYIPTDPRIVTEVDAKGNDVLDIALSGTNPTYRAVKVPLSQLSIDVLRKTAGP